VLNYWHKTLQRGRKSVRTTVRRRGESATVHIPTALLTAAGLNFDDAVELQARNGRIVIEPVRAQRYCLPDLVTAITEDNLHSAIEFGVVLDERG
jgi:antitoxin MazE